MAKESACNAGDTSSIPGSGRFPGEGNGNPLQSCLENPMDRGTWLVTVHRVTKSWTLLKRLSTHTHTHNTNTKYFVPFRTLENRIFLLRSGSGIHQKHAIRHLKFLLTLSHSTKNVLISIPPFPRKQSKESSETKLGWIVQKR